MKGHERWKLFAFFTLPNRFIYPVSGHYSFAAIRTYFFRIPMQTEDQQLSRYPLRLQQFRLGLLRHLVELMEQ